MRRQMPSHFDSDGFGGVPIANVFYIYTFEVCHSRSNPVEARNMALNVDGTWRDDCVSSDGTLTIRTVD